MFAFLVLLFIAMCFIAGIVSLFADGNIESLPFTCILGGILYLYFFNIYRSIKTGNYKIAQDTKSMQRQLRERLAIENRYGIYEKYDRNSRCFKELEAHSEKWAEPGTKAYEEIKRKEALFDAGHRW